MAQHELARVKREHQELSAAHASARARLQFADETLPVMLAYVDAERRCHLPSKLPDATSTVITPGRALWRQVPMAPARKTCSVIPLPKVVTISRMARTLGIRTVGELVEDEETMAKLRQADIDFAQGYGISRPQPLEDIA